MPHLTMASSTHRPLLNTPNNTSFCSRTLIFVLSLFAIILSSVFLAPHFIEVSLPSPSTPSHLCNQARDPQECLSIISEAVSKDGVQESNGIYLLQTLLVKSLSQMIKAKAAGNAVNSRINDHKHNAALADCIELLDLSIDRVTDTLSALANWSNQSDATDPHTWLSGVLTNHDTCLDGINAISQPPMKRLLQDVISRMRTALAVVASLSASDADNNVVWPLNGGFPSWILGRDRKLLDSSVSDVEANVVVAQDGSGDYTRIQEAVDSVPDKSKSRYVIYVKRGTYAGNVEVGKKKKNVMIVGEGMDLTIITGSLNVVDGSTTFKSATLAVSGDGFVLQDIWVQNTAGPEKHQAVALRVSADQSVINRCRIDAYQDTLYTHNHRQFYRDCSITGTIDYIFGNAAVVLQNCRLIARKPMANQKNMVTAQGRIDPNQNTGTSIQNCDIVASPDLESVQNSVPTYLGRPWKEYSRTVVMQSRIGGHIDPAGWAEWNKDFALKTLYYGEYANTGRGAGTSKRVNWPGYHVITDPNDAKHFTVGELIQGGAWLGSTGVSYTEGL